MIFIIVVIILPTAYQMTGHMSIEDRYTPVVGLPTSQEEEGGDTFFGFSAEGNPVLYMIILGILFVGSYTAYRKFKI